uniref:Uncharacterized protein n=1 Tax=Pararge aegeria TaxID=116150 RepID=S4PEI2_9NEOP
MKNTLSRRYGTVIKASLDTRKPFPYENRNFVLKVQVSTCFRIISTALDQPIKCEWRHPLKLIVRYLFLFLQLNKELLS